MKTSILMAAIVAGLGAQAAVAQNVHSDQDKARVEERSMQQKEQGAQGNAAAGQSDAQRGSSSNAGRSDASADGKATAERSDKAPGAGRTKDDIKAQDQSKADDEMARAENGQAKPGATGGTPGQSQSGVGHPQNAKTTGEGQGVKEEGSGTANNSGASGSSATGAGATTGSDARQ